MKSVRLLLSLLIMFAVVACTQEPAEQGVQDMVIEPSVQEEVVALYEPPVETILDQNQEFDEYKERFLRRYWELFPSYGVYVGYYEFDDQLVVPNGATRVLRRGFFVNQLEVLKTFDAVNLSVANATDLAIMVRDMKSNLWYIDKFRSYEWDPSSYNVAGTFGLILNTDYKPLIERLQTIAIRLDNIPAYYEAAKANLKTPTLPHLGLAIQQSQGALSMFEKTIPEKLQSVPVLAVSAEVAELTDTLEDAKNQDSKEVEEVIGEPEEVVKPNAMTQSEIDDFDLKLGLASQAIESYISWLEEKQVELEATGGKDFRIGEELYEKKFEHDIVSNYSAKGLYEIALQAKDTLHKDMIAISKELWPKYMLEQAMPEDDLETVKAMIDHLSLKHIERENFIGEIRRQMPIIQKFMDDNALLDSDPTRPLVVRETPEYQRGFAGASIDAPGPYDATANTYYNVSPLDDYTEEQAESYLREYNHWMLQILNIHEATPGHYTQLMHANKSPSKIKSIFANGAMIEGWANYSERMMLEAGYGDNEPEMWLMYYKWSLRVVVNTILDYSVQVLGMQKEEAIDMLINQAFQEQAEADGKWRRATVSQVQLTSYFSGYTEIYALREELKEKMGELFDLRTFHNNFLSYGNAPVPVIRSLMLEELGLE